MLPAWGMGWLSTAVLCRVALSSPARDSPSTASCSAASSGRETELCLRVKQSAKEVRNRRGHAKDGKPSNLAPSETGVLRVVLPVVRRKRQAQVSYVQRSVPALIRELGNLANWTIDVLVFGDRGEATSIALRHLKESPLPARFRARRKHRQLEDPSKLKKLHGDSLEKILWRSRLVLDFVSAARESSTASQPHILWLEDDVELLPGFGSLLQDWLHVHGERTDWLVLRLLGFQRDPDEATWAWGTAGWGGGGTLLYNGKNLLSHLDFLEQNFDAAPLDWLHRAMPSRPLAEWWQPQLQPVLLRHFGEHSTHEQFL